MFVIKKIGRFSFICETWYQFKVEYKWTNENDSCNVTIYNNKEDADEICENLNQDCDGNIIDVCEVVELTIEEFRLV